MKIMAIDLLAITPHEVSRDLSQKIILIYGEPKTGKTTIATQFEKSLLIAFEKGYNALSGVMAQNINKWSEFKQVLKQLDKPEVKSTFTNIIIDTVDLAYDSCESYITQRESVDKIGDIPYGGGYAMVKKEYDEALRSIPMKNFGLIMISHATTATFTLDDGTEYAKTTTTLNKRAKAIVHPMADIIGYAKAVEKDGETKVAFFLRGTPQFEAGSRFKHVPPVIELNYDKLVETIATAIEKEEQEKGQKNVVEKGQNLYHQEDAPTFEDQKKKLKELSAKLVETKGADEAKTTIKSLIEGYMGKGKTLKDITSEQVEQLTLIIIDVEDIIAK